MAKSKYSLFWFRRDLRLEDNRGLYEALSGSEPVIPIFIFDKLILDKISSQQDLRVQFIHQEITHLKMELQKIGSDLLVFYGEPLQILKSLHTQFSYSKIFTNHDYEPYPRRRDRQVLDWANLEGVDFFTFKDQVIFEKSDIMTDQGKPYTVYTPYKKKWLSRLQETHLQTHPSEKLLENFWKSSQSQKLVSLKDLNFETRDFVYPEKRVKAGILKTYAETRDTPSLDKGTSHMGVHLRFGTVSVRKLVALARENSDVWLSELIWREFFMQILWHYPDVVKSSFRPAYEKVVWRKNTDEFKKWCEGNTGFPLVDAGMRELNQTGYMHNRVRMVAASFLTKHLLMHWYQGERYFASKLLDYDLSANNGNWQWAAGTGCDAAPYFRVFNPQAQLEKFDPELLYIKKWIPEYGTAKYPAPMVDHKQARMRCLEAFKLALKGDNQ